MGPKFPRGKFSVMTNIPVQGTFLNPIIQSMNGHNSFEDGKSINDYPRDTIQLPSEVS